MTFSEYLKEQFELGEPIYIEKIQYDGFSGARVFKELENLADSGELRRFDTGIYFFPRMMFYGEAGPNPRKVIEHRFLSDGNEVYGYAAGFNLLNLAGVSTQVPYLIEIVTNNESADERKFKVGRQRVLARRSRTTITKDNVGTQQLLELMNDITPEDLDDVERFLLERFVRSLGATRESVMQYAGFFPARSMENLIESGVIYELASGQ